MPLALDPTAVVPVRLSTDPVSVFLARFRTVRESVKLAGLLADAAKAEDWQAREPLYTQVLAVCLAGWTVAGPDGQPVPFDPARIDDVLTLGEKSELVDKCLEATRLEEEKKRSSASPSPSTTGASAAAVPPPADASTSPAPPSP